MPPTQLDLKPVMGVAYVAALMDVEPDTVKDYVRARKLRAARIGATWLFTADQFQQDIAALADAGAEPPKPLAVQHQPPKRKGRPDLALLGA